MTGRAQRMGLSATGFVLLAAAVGCSPSMTLTQQGHDVSQVTRADRLDGCRFVDDVAIGVPPDVAQPGTKRDLAVLMRNKAGKRGGTHVVVDSKRRRGRGEDRHWVARGRTYSCRADSSPPEEQDIGLPNEEEPEQEDGPKEASPARDGAGGERAQSRGLSDQNLLGDS